MKRWASSVIILLLVFGSVFALVSITDFGQEDVRPTSSTTVSTQSTTTTQLESVTPTSTSSSQTPTTFTPSTIETSSVLLSLSEIPGNYNITIDATTSALNNSSSSQEPLQSTGIIKTHRRLFTRQSKESNYPKFLLSKVTLYNSSRVATQAFKDDLQSYRNRNADISRTNITQELNVYKIKYEDSDGFNHTLLYYRSKNAVYFVKSTTIEKHPISLLRRLIVKMHIDFEAEVDDNN